jgi:hypothetical protein
VKPAPVEPTPDEQAVLDAARDCPHRGPVVDSDPACRCGPTVLCTRDVRVVGFVDCVACRFGEFAGAAPGLPCPDRV